MKHLVSRYSKIPLLSLIIAAILLISVFALAAPVQQARGAPRCTLPPDGLTSWWTFDETEDSVAADLAGENNGTIIGAAPAAGLVDGALQFDGYNDYVDINSVLVNNGSDFSYSVWVKPIKISNNPGMFYMIISQHRGAGNGAYPLYLRFAPDRVGFQSGTNGTFAAHAYERLPVGEWTHLAATADSSNFKLYINGVLKASAIRLDPTAGRLQSPFRIGNGLHLPYHFGFNGTIDEVALFNRSLSQSEVQAIYNAGSAGMCKASTPEVINSIIQSLQDNAFQSQADNRKAALADKLLSDGGNSVQELIDTGLYQDAIDKLNHDIRAKMDGTLGGNPSNDWITDSQAQADLNAMIDSLIEYIQALDV